MRIVVAVVVYNRFANIKRWIECWQQSNTKNAELVIIHNYYGIESEKEKYQNYCEKHNIKYIPRNGQGMDIGAMQDVFKNTIPLDYDFLLWCCDDTLPMTKDFISPFIDKFKDGVGITCMQIASSVRGEIHVRTTGFCIKKEVAEKIKFPADPIITKHHCYLFEHKGVTLTDQVRAMGLSIEQVAPNKTSPLWDQGYWKRLDRAYEHEQVFGSKEYSNKIVFICPIYDKYPQIISSLICQSENNWELMLIDDNDQPNNTKQIVEQYNDPRIKYIKKDRVGNWGHPLRKWALEELTDSSCEYICVSNPDNYYTPNFIKEVREAFKKSHTAVAVYPDKMVHSYKNWDIIPCKLERGYLDCGGVVIKKEVACSVGWNSFEHSADWEFFNDIAHSYSWKNFIPIKGCFFIHN